jgi:hypothetical protein
LKSWIHPCTLLLLTLSDISLYKYKFFIQIEKSLINQVLSFCQLWTKKVRYP